MSEENLNQEAPQERNWEKEARSQNWVPKEEYKGDPNSWVDAKTFVERGEQINPILRANNERLMRELDKTKKEMQDLRSAAEEFRQFQKTQYERKAADLEQQIVQLREEKKRAISAGDGDRAVQLDDQIDDLKEQKAEAKAESKKEAPPPKQEEPELSPELVEWVESNKWYKDDVLMADMANAEAARINRIYPHLIGKAFLEKLDESLDQIFSAEKLGRSKKERPRSPVEGTTTTSTESSSKKSYDALPPEAKAACDKFVKQKLMTREQYVAEYFS